jgi:hypothetical protein
MRDYLPKKKDTTAKERISSFLSGSNSSLNGDDEMILQRWILADQMMQNFSPIEDITKKLCLDFDISIYTAHRDVFDSMSVLGASRKIDKRYLLFNKMQRQEKDLLLIRKTIDDGQLWDNPKMIMALMKAEELLTLTINSFPKEEEKIQVLAPIVNLNMPVEYDQFKIDMSEKAALLLADDLIKKDLVKAHAHEYINEQE